MKWFKHDSDARHDARLQRVRLKYGMEGYGLYFFLLECIAGTVEKHNLTFELEEDSELISVATNIHVERVQEMMVYMVNLGLFEDSGGRITCLKMATRTDEYTQKLIKNQGIVGTRSGQTPDMLGTKSELIEQKRTEEKRPGRRFAPPTLDDVKSRISEMGYRHVDPESFVNFYASKNWMVGKNKMSDWQRALAGWESRHKSGSSGDSKSKTRPAL